MTRSVDDLLDHLAGINMAFAIICQRYCDQILALVICHGLIRSSLFNHLVSLCGFNKVTVVILIQIASGIRDCSEVKVSFFVLVGYRLDQSLFSCFNVLIILFYRNFVQFEGKLLEGAIFILKRTVL